MRITAGRILGTTIIVLACLVVLSWTPALAADNYGDVTSTLTGNWTNYGTVTTPGDHEPAMSSGVGETSTNAASGTLSTSGTDSYGIKAVIGTAYNYGNIRTSGQNGLGIYANTSTIYNHGSISTTGTIAEGIECSSSTVYNYGDITATGSGANGIVISLGTLYNTGVISATKHAIAIGSNGGEVHLLTGTRILDGNVYAYPAGGNLNNLYLDGSGIVDFDIAGTWHNSYKTGSGTWTLARNISSGMSFGNLRLEGGTLAISPGVTLQPVLYSQNAGTTLSVALDGALTPLLLGGTATLQGTLEVDVASTALGASHNVLIAVGGRVNTFDSFVSSNPSFSVNVAYQPDRVSVTSSFTPQWDAPSLGVASTLASAQGFSSVATSRSLTLLAQADDSQDREILVASVGSLDGLLASSDEETRWGLYLQPMYATGSRDASAGSIGYDWNMAGFEAGLDYRLAPDLLVGAMGGYGSTKLEFMGSKFVENDTEDQDMTTVGLYAGWAPGPWRITDVLSVGRVEHESQRNAGLGQTAEADYDSWIWANRAQLVYVWVPAENWEISPRVGLDTIHVSRGGFEEHGAANAVRYDDLSKTFWEGSLGVRAAYSFDVERAVLTPYAGLGYGHDLSGNDITVRQYLPTASAQVTTENDNDRWTTELGLTLARLPLELTLAYDGEFSDNTESHGLSATLRWEF